MGKENARKNLITFILLETFLLISLVMLIIGIKQNSPLISNLDNFAFKVAGFLRNNFINNLMLLITFLGEFYIYISAILIFFIFRIKNIALTLGFFTGISALINYALKNIIVRLRPIGQFVTNLIFPIEFPSSYSFPSGHTQNAFVFYFLLSYILIDKYYKKKHKKLLLTLCLILPLLIGFSRIILGVHFFTDILAGMIIATIIVSFYIFLSKRKVSY